MREASCSASAEMLEPSGIYYTAVEQAFRHLKTAAGTEFMFAITFVCFELVPKSVTRINMNLYMPLECFHFHDDGQSKYSFSKSPFRIERDALTKEMRDGISELGLFSKWSLDQIRSSFCFLIAEGMDAESIKQDANLLMMTFWLLGDDITPFYRFVISEDNRNDSVQHSQLEPNCVDDPPWERYSFSRLDQIDQAYSILKSTDAIRWSRPHNAIYFLYMGLHTHHWISRFSSLMTCLESVFGKNERRGMTQRIASRASNFVSDASVCTKADILELYDTRSRITHGDIKANEEPAKNLRHLKRLERVVKACFRKIIDTQAFDHYQNELSKERYLSQFD